MKLLIPFALLLTIFVSCNNFRKMKEMSDDKFSDQHFKTAIAHIELYKVRYGQYPPLLDSLTFLGDWDRMIFAYVKYEKLDTGYRLDIKGGPFGGNPSHLQYPPVFWQGLGIKKSNLLQTQVIKKQPT